MIDVSNLPMVGPLLGPECAWAARRTWLYPARVVAGTLAAAPALVIVWWWWVNWERGVDPEFSPFEALRIGLVLLLALAASISLVLAPAVVAGGLTGDQERGLMGLLLTTRLNAFEIVAGRTLSRLSQIAMILLALLPPMLLLAALSGIGPRSLAVLILFGPCLALGAGGIASGVATLSRRGRDALLGTYALGGGLLIASAMGDRFGPPGPRFEAVLSALNPYRGLWPLVRREEVGPALLSILIWGVCGLIGFGVAVLRLRAVRARWLDGPATRRARRAQRRSRALVLENRPMIWKEISIDGAGPVRGIGRWLGRLGLLYLWGVALWCGGNAAFALIVARNESRSEGYVDLLRQLIGDTSTFFGLFIIWAVGLRAAVAVAMERERDTWDALLTSPLTGREIVLGKLVGSLHSLRWLALATLFAWSTALVLGAIRPIEYAYNLAWTLVVSTFMAAVGVRISLSTATATTAMALTIGAWLTGAIVVSIASGILVGIGALSFLVLWLLADAMALWSRPTPWFPIGGSLSFALVQLAIYLGIAAAIVVETWARFDRLTGRVDGYEPEFSAEDRAIPAEPLAVAATTDPMDSRGLG